MMRHNIPDSITGGFRFYDREEIKDIISMLRFVYNPRDVISFSRFMNKPRRGLGSKCVQAISASSLRGGLTNGLQQYLSQSTDMKEANKNAIFRLIENIFSKPVKDMPLKELTEHLVEETKYKDYLILPLSECIRLRIPKVSERTL
jgi:DNA helicase-2/ATP-dependent DNA helicase PcrA